MAMYMHATIRVAPGKFPEFCAVMEEVKAAVTARGWKLVGAYTNMIGRLHEVVDVWEVEDANHVQSVFMALYTLPNWPEIEKKLAEVVVEEVTKLMTPLPYN